MNKMQNNPLKDLQTNAFTTCEWNFEKLYNATHPNGTRGNLYLDMLTEEFNELKAEKGCTAEEFKELCDVIWCAIMYAIERGYPLNEGMNELVREYSSKFYDAEGNYNPQYREDGKLLKGSGFKKADFDQFF